MDTIYPQMETTGDGTATFRHPVFGDTYHSLNGATAEAEHVYIQAGLAAAGKTDVKILEVGFGSGLNAWLTLMYGAGHMMNIDYTAVELYPVNPNVAIAAGYTDSPLFRHMHECAWDSPQRITGQFTLTKYATDLTRPDGAWERSRYDVVYFDAFAPDTQPEMWSNEIFARIHTAMQPDGILVTYSAKGSVKQALRNAGFQVRRIAGAPGKRHMLQAVATREAALPQ